MTRSHLIVLALLLSVGVNLLVAGTLLGRLSRQGESVPPPPMDWAARELPGAQRGAVRAALRERLPAVQPQRRALRESMQAIRRLATAEEFDPQAMRAALARQRAAQSAYQAVMHEAAVEVAASLPRAQRMDFLSRALQRDSQRRVRPGALPDRR